MGRIPHFLRFFVVLVVLLGLTNCVGAGDDRGEPVAFKAEVSKMLDILVNSLYTNRDIFLREIISNGSDALDKIRVMYLTNPKEPVDQYNTTPTMDIRFIFDKEENTLIMRDGGVGMTKAELAQNLGSLGTSGTKNFLEKLQEASTAGGGGGNNNNLIGQFGVGFYSVFLVADRVKVASKSDEDDTQWVWESTGDGQFFLYADPRGNTLGRGTEISMVLKADAEQYLDSDVVKRIIRQYSEFIHFPIWVQETVQANAEKMMKRTRKAPGEETVTDEDAIEEEFAEDDDHPIAKDMVSVQWTMVNENKPIWTRELANISNVEYDSFYKSLTNDFKPPMYHSHFKVKGEVEFDAILFIPERVDPSLYQDDGGAPSKNIKLYVRRVFITDEFRDLLPRYLSFVKGVVDSNDLPLNVSRELLQESRILRVIKKKLVRRVLMMFSDMIAQDEALAKGNNEPRPQSGNRFLVTPTYNSFWEKYGRLLRLGVLTDSNNRNRLTKLFRYTSSHSNSALIGFQDYVDRMKKGQKGIYYLSGDSEAAIRRTPLFEDADNQGVEVLFMTDPIDEYAMSQVTDFGGKRLINLAKETVKFDRDEDDERQRIIRKKRNEKFEPLFSRLRSLFKYDAVHRIELTKRQTKQAFVITSGQAMSARMANLMRGQAVGSEGAAKADRVLEVNYRHPLVQEMFNRFSVDDDDAVAVDLAWVLYDTANLQGDFPVADLSAYAQRINRLLRSSVDIDPSEDLLPSDEDDYGVPKAAVKEGGGDVIADMQGDLILEEEEEAADL